MITKIMLFSVSVTKAQLVVTFNPFNPFLLKLIFIITTKNLSIFISTWIEIAPSKLVTDIQPLVFLFVDAALFPKSKG